MSYDNPINPGFDELGGTTPESAKDAAQADLIPKGNYQGTVESYKVRDAHEKSPFAGTKLVQLRVNLEGTPRPLFFDVSGFDRRWPDGGMAREHKLLNMIAEATGTVGKGTEAIIQAAQYTPLTYKVVQKMNEGKDRDPENVVVAVKAPK